MSPDTMDPEDSHGVERQFDPLPEAAAEARRFVLQTMDLDDGDDARLATLVSELATNAILYARTPFTVRVTGNDGRVRVAVRDGSPTLPVSKQYVPNQPTGRGLFIVDTLSDRWGVSADEDGKTVWFEIDRVDRGS